MPISSRVLPARSASVSSGYSYDTITVDKWYRFVLAVDLSAHVFRIYLDGQIMHIGTPSAFNLDNRFAIQSIDALNKLILLGDDDGDDGDMDVAFIALYDRQLTDTEVEAWGGYGTPIRSLSPISGGTSRIRSHR